jgi:hypothetical protein
LFWKYRPGGQCSSRLELKEFSDLGTRDAVDFVERERLVKQADVLLENPKC